MKRIQSILVLLAAFPGVFLPLACGSKDNEIPLEQAEGGQGGTSGREASDRVAGEAQGKGEGGAGKDASFDPQMEEDEQPLDSPDTDSEETVSNDCDLENEDLPDDDFIDSNCDGIDGDVTRAVFVAPTGNDFARGTMEDPLRTIQAAIDSARELDQDVYVVAPSMKALFSLRTTASIYTVATTVLTAGYALWIARISCRGTDPL